MEVENNKYVGVPLWRFGAKNQAICLQAVAICLQAVEAIIKSIKIQIIIITVDVTSINT